MYLLNTTIVQVRNYLIIINIFFANKMQCLCRM
uniref:Uncharacterized protein n=1 Tax=Arundo donax TaxID=35708 RepID=A0A0A9H9X6_ARUDO